MDGGAWWAAGHGVAKSRTWLSDFTFTFHFHVLEKEMATHSSVLAWRIPGTGEPHGLPSMGSHRVRHDWSDLAAAAEWRREKMPACTVYVKCLMECLFQLTNICICALNYDAKCISYCGIQLKKVWKSSILRNIPCNLTFLSRKSYFSTHPTPPNLMFVLPDKM